jgi:hypothetical protein
MHVQQHPQLNTFPNPKLLHHAYPNTNTHSCLHYRSWVHRPVDSKQISYCRQLMYEDAVNRTEPHTLVMYHLGEAGEGDSKQVFANNLDVFSTAVTAKDPAFYLFNVLGGAKNPFYPHLPWHLMQSSSMCIVHWDSHVVGDLTVAALTAAHLGPAVALYESILYLNQVRTNVFCYILSV